MAKVCKNMHENVEMKMFLQHSLYLSLSISKKISHASDFQKCIFSHQSRYFWSNFHLGKTHLSILSGEMSPGRLGEWALLLDISVKMEFIHFLQPRIKQNCESIITSPEKYVICIDYAQPSSPFTRMPAWTMSWLMPICPGHGDRDYDQGIILNLTFFREGG